MSARITINEVAHEHVLFSIAGETWMLMARASRAELGRLRAIETASWDDRGSIQAGTVDGLPLWWSSGEGRLTVLVGRDDESWSVALTEPYVPGDLLRQLDQELARVGVPIQG